MSAGNSIQFEIYRASRIKIRIYGEKEEEGRRAIRIREGQSLRFVEQVQRSWRVALGASRYDVRRISFFTP